MDKGYSIFESFCNIQLGIYIPSYGLDKLTLDDRYFLLEIYKKICKIILYYSNMGTTEISDLLAYFKKESKEIYKIIRNKPSFSDRKFEFHNLFSLRIVEMDDIINPISDKDWKKKYLKFLIRTADSTQTNIEDWINEYKRFNNLTTEQLFDQCFKAYELKMTVCNWHMEIVKKEYYKLLSKLYYVDFVNP